MFPFDDVIMCMYVCMGFLLATAVSRWWHMCPAHHWKSWLSRVLHLTLSWTQMVCGSYLPQVDVPLVTIFILWHLIARMYEVQRTLWNSRWKNIGSTSIKHKKAAFRIVITEPDMSIRINTNEFSNQMLNLLLDLRVSYLLMKVTNIAFYARRLWHINLINC